LFLQKTAIFRKTPIFFNIFRKTPQFFTEIPKIAIFGFFAKQK